MNENCLDSPPHRTIDIQALLFPALHVRPSSLTGMRAVSVKELNFASEGGGLLEHRLGFFRRQSEQRDWARQGSLWTQVSH
eukprot:768136-Hanusia_phi.AAC.3